MDLKGLSIKDITNMEWDDIQKLTRKELSSITSRLVSATNKRLRRLESSELGESPALRSFMTRTGELRLSVKGKSHGQLQQVFTEAKHFLGLKTSTIKGYKNVIGNIKETITQKTGRSISEIDVGKLYDALHKGQEMGLIDARGTKGSEYAVGQIIELLENNPDKGIDDIIDDLEDWYNEFYEDTFDYDDEDDDSIFFDDDF